MGLFAGVRERLGWAARIVAGIAMAALLTAALVRDLYYFPQSARWPATEAEVIASRFVMDDDFSVDFRYRYQVDGINYVGDRITFFEYAVFANRVQNERFVDRHPVGTRITVRYDPAEPSRSVMMRMIPLEQMWSPLLLALCLGTVLVSGAAGFALRYLLRGMNSRLGMSFGQRGAGKVEDRPGP